MHSKISISLILILFPILLFAQWPSGFNRATWDDLEDAVKDSIRALGGGAISGDSSFVFFDDTTEMKASYTVPEGNAVFLKQLSSTNSNGGGFFVQADSTLPESVYAFDNATSGKQWIRIEALNKQIYTSWVGGDTLLFERIFTTLPDSGYTIHVNKDIDISSKSDSINVADYKVYIHGYGHTITGNVSATVFNFQNSFEISDLTFQTAKEGITGYALGDSATGIDGSYALIENCNFYNVKIPIDFQISHNSPEGAGVTLKYIKVINCYMDNWKQGIGVEDLFVDEVIVDKCHFSNCNFYDEDINIGLDSRGLGNLDPIAIRVGYGNETADMKHTKLIVTNCTFDTIRTHRDGRQAYGVINYRGDMVASGNIANWIVPTTVNVLSGSAWLYSRGPGREEITDNILSDCSMGPIGAIQVKDTWDSLTVIKDNIITFSDAYNDTAVALSLTETNGIYCGNPTTGLTQIIGNTIINPLSKGIFSKNVDRDLEIYNNRVEGAGEYALSIYNGGDLFNIHDNLFKECKNGIFLAGSVGDMEHIILKNNTIEMDTLGTYGILLARAPLLTEVVGNSITLINDSTSYYSTTFYQDSGYTRALAIQNPDSVMGNAGTVIIRDNIFRGVDQNAQTLVEISDKYNTVDIENNSFSMGKYAISLIDSMAVENFYFIGNTITDINNANKIYSTYIPSTCIIKDNRGEIITLNSGIVTFSGYEYRKQITHGLFSPAYQSFDNTTLKYFNITPMSKLENNNYWTSDIGSSTFKINFQHGPGGTLTSDSSYCYGDSTYPGTVISYTGDYIYYYKITTTSDLRCDTLAIYLQQVNTATAMKGAIYSNSVDNKPGELIDSTAEITGSPVTDNTLHKMAFINRKFLSAGTYWIAHWQNDDIRKARSAGGSNNWTNESKTYGVWPTNASFGGYNSFSDVDSWIIGQSADLNQYNVYWEGHTFWPGDVNDTTATANYTDQSPIQYVVLAPNVAYGYGDSLFFTYINATDSIFYALNMPYAYNGATLKIDSIIVYLKGDASSLIDYFEIITNNYGSQNTIYSYLTDISCTGSNQAITYIPNLAVISNQTMLILMKYTVNTAVRTYAFKVFMTPI